MKNNKYKRGQVLLVLVLLLATTLTIVMTVVFTSRSETTISKLQQDSERSLAAAEAGIEAAINSQSAGQVSFEDLDNIDNLSGIDLSESNVVINNLNTDGYFVSPVITKDKQYTLYLSSYDNDGFGTTMPGDLYIYYGTEGTGDKCAAVALELTLISFDNPDTPIVNRYIADTADKFETNVDEIGSTTAEHPIPNSDPNTKFYCRLHLDDNQIDPNAKMLIIRAVGTTLGTRIGVDDRDLPGQGTAFSSEARTTSGVTKQVKVFKSHPQIPAEFFVTRI